VTSWKDFEKRIITARLRFLFRRKDVWRLEDAKWEAARRKGRRLELWGDESLREVANDLRIISLHKVGDRGISGCVLKDWDLAVWNGLWCMVLNVY
jgi:hypothetical protein